MPLHSKSSLVLPRWTSEYNIEIEFNIQSGCGLDFWLKIGQLSAVGNTEINPAFPYSARNFLTI